MRILYYDCFAGISGDMNLGALLDAGVPEKYLREELKKLNVEGYTIKVSSELKMGISGTYAHVELHQAHGHSHDHVHRNLKDIEEIIDRSDVSEYVKEKSKQMFLEIARAEAKIHAKSITDIHFHEVGAIDSIVDIVGAAISIDYLKPDRIVASTVELGDGFVKCAHGTFPVPAPATAEILKGIPVKTGGADAETTTPTGAAILKVFVDEFTDQTRFGISKVAYGIGYRDLKIPNVLRVYLGDTATATGKDPDESYETAEALQIECNIDDMNPEQYEYIMNRLFDAGAHDVSMVPMIMKKSRPAILLRILCSLEKKEEMEQIILNETTSIGIRYYPVTKTMLSRSIRTIETRFGPIRIKEANLPGTSHKYKAEYEDCVKAAKKAKVSLREIYREVEKCVEKTSKS